ncbi:MULTISPECIES: uracil-DNA glycosylase family protein [unclassified Lentimonas]|uniref:uracil-DNA glycosylase n=1 Tax=unclassified Lentimonas TaxID=2630993 RepID=UPI00138A5E1E|nr:MULTISPECIES: uracil-DNA glycosylase [unclassified Lentimonas]
MSIGLDAVYEELKRLQLEGMDRVFIEDRTMALLQPAPKPPEPKAPRMTIDLQSAVNSNSKPTELEPKPAPRKKAPAVTISLPEAPTIELPDGDANTQMQWLKERVKSCPTCTEQLREGEQVVFGTGAINADIFYCGEAPGEEEAETGSPFQGKAGELLTKILGAMGLSRESVYLTNIMKWRPKHNKPYGNRPPTQEEMEFCLPYLKAQIEIVQPKVIIGLGNTTVPGLLGADPDRKMASIRGSWQTFEGVPLIFTFQPSYLLFNDTMKTKRMAWEDMLKAMEKVGLPISEKQQGYFLPK